MSRKEFRLRLSGKNIQGSNILAPGVKILWNSILPPKNKCCPWNSPPPHIPRPGTATVAKNWLFENKHSWTDNLKIETFTGQITVINYTHCRLISLFPVVLPFFIVLPFFPFPQFCFRFPVSVIPFLRFTRTNISSQKSSLLWGTCMAY